MTKKDGIKRDRNFKVTLILDIVVVGGEMRLVKLCDILNLAFKKRNPTLCQLTYNHRDLSIHIERACLASLHKALTRNPV